MAANLASKSTAEGARGDDTAALLMQKVSSRLDVVERTNDEIQRTNETMQRKNKEVSTRLNVVERKNDEIQSHLGSLEGSLRDLRVEIEPLLRNTA